MATGKQSTTYDSTPSKPLDDSYYQKQDTYSKKYNEAREKGDASGMRDANDAMNQVRNQYGLAAQFANEDIAKIAAQERAGSHSGGGGGGGSSGGSSGVGGNGGGQIVVEGPERTVLSAPADYSGYIEEMNRARQEAALNDLKAAYEKNVAALDRTKGEIGPAFQKARNQTAGDSERAKRQFALYAAASGLNNGAAGQAELARQNTLQGNLSELNTQEASKLSDLELQRSQMETDYNNAIVKAKAEGDYALASQLYQEKVRVDDALRQMQIQQAQLDLQNWQANYGILRDQAADGQYAQELQLKLQQWQAEQQKMAGAEEDRAFERQQQIYKQQQEDYKNALAAAQYYAKYGDLSGFEALGKDTAQMQKYLDEQRAQEQAEIQAKLQAQQEKEKKKEKEKTASAGKKAAGGSTKKSSGSTGGKTAASGSGIIDAMLTKGSQAKAYEYLVGLGLAQGKTDQLWSLYLEENAKVEAGKTDKGWIAVPGYGRLTRAEVDAMVKRGDIIKSYDAKTGRYSYRKRSN